MLQPEFNNPLYSSKPFAKGSKNEVSRASLSVSKESPRVFGLYLDTVNRPTSEGIKIRSENQLGTRCRSDDMIARSLVHSAETVDWLHAITGGRSCERSYSLRSRGFDVSFYAKVL